MMLQTEHMLIALCRELKSLEKVWEELGEPQLEPHVICKDTQRFSEEFSQFVDRADELFDSVSRIHREATILIKQIKTEHID